MTSILFSGDICELCCSEFNNAKNTRVDCPSCDYPVCRACTRIYLLGTMDLPHCLNCKNRWELDVLTRNTLKSFVNGDYKEHRKKMLMDHEKSRMPETMSAVENYKKVKELTAEYREESKKLRDLEEACYNLKWKVSGIKSRLNDYKNGVESKQNKRKFKQKCPKDGCLGFLSTQWKCGLCNTKVCSKCLAIKEEGFPHECNEDDVKSAELIKKETRSCPSCGTNIYKIMGCDMMWCVQCHTAFSWKTGMKLTGVIHNPHFFQWQANGGQAPPINLPGVQMCGGIPFWTTYRYNVRDQLIKLFKNDSVTQNRLRTFARELYRSCHHFNEVELDGIRLKVNNAGDNKILRIKYMAGEIKEANFKSQIMSKDKKHNKLLAILEVYELVNVILSETLRDVHESAIEFRNNYNQEQKDDENYIENIKQECIAYFDNKINRIEKVRTYANYELLKISVLYSQKVGIINKDYYTNSYKFKKKDIELYKDKHHLIGA